MWVLRDADREDGLTLRLTTGSVRTVGRARRADFVVEAPLVSRMHCRLTVRADGGLEVEDLGSTNGTYVNGKKVKRAELRDGDELRVGRVKLKVRAE